MPHKLCQSHRPEGRHLNRETNQQPRQAKARQARLNAELKRESERTRPNRTLHLPAPKLAQSHHKSQEPSPKPRQRVEQEQETGTRKGETKERKEKVKEREITAMEGKAKEERREEITGCRR